MLRDYFMLVVRGIARDRFYTAIGIFVLAIGLCAAILMALCIRAQLSYEHFIPGYERIYVSATVEELAGQAPLYSMKSPSWLAGLLKLKFAEIEATTRLAAQDVQLRQEAIEAKERIYWADRNLFDVLPMPVFAGDPAAALQRPDGIVMTRSTARKYFGHDDAIGQALQLDGRQVMTVLAVLEDLPVNGTLLESGIFASGIASQSLLARYDRDPKKTPGRGLAWDVITYLRLAPNASIEQLQDSMQAFASEVIGPAPMPGLRAFWQFIRSDRVHLFHGFNPSAFQRNATAGALGALILLVACAVFVNLATARAARRTLEVGVRKACGADRAALVRQFIGESLSQVLLAAAIAMALMELLLPSVNAFTQAGAVFDYWRNPALLAWIGMCVLLVGVLVGAYPAVVLASFRPADVFRKKAGAGHAIARHALVILQFAVLIGLIIVAGVIYRQHRYAMNEALRVNVDKVLIIRSPCSQAFKNELRALPGVRGAFCSGAELLNGISFANFRLQDGSQQTIGMTVLEPGVFNVYGLKPVAGQFSDGGDVGPHNASQYVINESAVPRLGFTSPAAAIGRSISIKEGSGADDLGTVIGVAPDFSLGSVQQAIKPSIYSVTRDRDGNGLINVKLTGRNVPETLAAIDKLWRATGAVEPIDRFFVDEYLQRLYLTVLRWAQMVAIFSGIALLLACIGLIGLAASTTERRTKEVGIRKAMGASTGAIMQMFVWQFAKPVLYASLLSWPIAALTMQRWLQGFAYHVDLQAWIFFAATALALLLAVVTISGQCYLAARAKPIHALRYE